ncbi:MAG: hypothetical protein IJI92_07990 [Erysipelotrichaceae bacterium]|nr:hypothetical protein [Erysipelotrichaceae bacterium]
MKSKGSVLLKILIVIFMIILFFNSMMAVLTIRKDVSYKNRSYGLTVMDDYFNSGNYYEIYLCSLKNEYVSEEPYVDVSQYEAFGRFYHAYMMAKMYPDESKYREQMEKEKAQISWKKILNTVAILENDLKK